MFVYSVRASTIKFFAVIALALIALVIALSFGGGEAVYASLDGKEINYGGVKTAEDRLEFIRGFGIEVAEAPTTEETFSMPESFDRVINGYNEIQKRQGLDLTKYAKKRVTHYAYEVTNWSGEGKVYVNLIIHRNKIIACDISSAEAEGFVLPLTEIDGKILAGGAQGGSVGSTNTQNGAQGGSKSQNGVQNGGSQSDTGNKA